jgi:RsiW-degrading membrane proteinase PrsW (M82 family)
MNRTNGLYLIIGALIVAVVGLGAYTYHEKTKPKGVELSIGKDGVSVQEK